MSEVRFKRSLGNGQWDRKLKENLVIWSEADNYDEAKHEWIATGNIWWGNETQEEVPRWAMAHQGYCLCGHKIFYHFEILNTENGKRECVGSDHINSYLILREIKERTGLRDDEITDEMIQAWIDERIESMKCESWWERNGEEFTRKFEEIRELDLRINVNYKGTYYDSDIQQTRDRTVLRKRANGGKMASIVWRWNHPDNKRNQRDGRGYPNKQLLEDLDDFYSFIEEHRQTVLMEDADYQAKLEAVRHLRTLRVEKSRTEVVDGIMEFYGIADYRQKRNGLRVVNQTYTNDFISSIETQVITGKTLTEKQLKALHDIFSPPTDKQISYMESLGIEAKTKLEASFLIGQKINEGAA